ncbi:hypothetical protein AHMF7605_08565 [Adhaeribacter arboris]|uniref:CHAT domain-containing protein n=1 Tax=Adhaeribacter arboris TaxID=2072846 RepID=A0A2T2YDJ5_9BACT|nr:CHAT domain-containing protein [Adhaeribacter arboris]PSR53576.1 hypothetical protein AHMF7605_08565 [Adhaeribacter arboris]
MMKSLLLGAIFLLSSFNKIAFARQPQIIVDFRHAQNLYQQALRLQQEGEYHSSLMMFKKASQEYKEHRLWAKKLDCDNEFIQNLILLGRYNEALHKANQTLKESLSRAKGDPTGAYINLGNVYYEKGQYDKALAYFQKVLQYQRTKFGETHPKVASTYINLGKVYFEKAEYAKALGFYQKALFIRHKFFKETHPVIANSYQAFVNIYIAKRESKQALEYQQKALKIQLTALGQTHPDVADSYFNLGDVYYNKGNYEKAFEYHQRAFLIRQSVFGVSHVKVADSYNNLGKILQVKGEYKKALSYLFKSLEIRRTTLGKSHPKVADLYNNLGKTYQAKGDYEKALQFHQKALQCFLSAFGRMHPGVADAYKELGNTYFEKGEYEEALGNYQQTLEIRRTVSGEAHTSVANSYYVIGKVFSAKGEYDKALEYFHKSLQIRLAAHGETQHNVADSYNEIGNIYQVKEEHRRALEYYQKALRIRRIIFGVSHSKVAESYNNLGKVYYSSGDYDKALEYHQMALQNYHKTLGESHPGTAESYNYLGNVYQATGGYKEAAQYHYKALQSYLKTFGKSHPAVADTYNNLGNVYRLTGELKKSLQQYQKAIIANTPTFQDTLIAHNPIVAGHGKPHLTPKDLLFSLRAKAGILERLYSQSNTTEDLILALQTSCSADSLAYKIQQNYTEENDKVAFSADVMELYQQTQSLCLKLYRITKDSHYLDKAFYFAERGKASVLTASLTESKAKAFADIPDSLLKQEQNYRNQIAQFSQRLAKELAKGNKADSSILIHYQNQLFTAHLQQDSLVNEFEKSYPKFYALKYQLKSVTPKQLQDVLDKKTALLEYTLTDNFLQVFIISHKFYKVETVFLDSLFHRRLVAFREGILLKDQDLYQQVAYNLYKTLIPQSLSKSIKSLIIIPAGELTTLPFEALLTKPAEVVKGKRNPYLLNKYNVSYAYSARLLYERLIQPQETPTKKLLAMAPVFTEIQSSNQEVTFQNTLLHQELFVEDERDYDESSIQPPLMNVPLHNSDLVIKENLNAKIDYTKTRLSSIDGQELPPLPGSEQEVIKISKLFQAKGFSSRVLLHQNASENQIKRPELIKFNYIHLATHGFVNKNYPELSGLVLTQNQTNQEDGILYFGEIYNLHLNADLVTLSACETGLGKIVQGEGVINLTRALLYAGAKNIMVSMWKVSDKSTSDLMEYFYQELLSGKDKSTALQLAKRSLIRQGKYDQPFYWAPFILVGK